MRGLDQKDRSGGLELGLGLGFEFVFVFLHSKMMKNTEETFQTKFPII